MAFSDCPLPSPSCFFNCYETQLLSLPSKTLLTQYYHLPELDLIQSAELPGFAHMGGICHSSCWPLGRYLHLHTGLSFAPFPPLRLTVVCRRLFWSGQSVKVCMYGYGVCLCRQKNHTETDGHTHTHTVARWWQTWLTPWLSLLWILSSCFLLSKWCQFSFVFKMLVQIFWGQL